MIPPSSNSLSNMRPSPKPYGQNNQFSYENEYILKDENIQKAFESKYKKFNTN